MMAARHQLIIAALAALLAACATASPAATPATTSILPSVAPTGPAATPEPSAPVATSTASAMNVRWARLASAGPRPAAREDHTWTVDDAGRYAYLFGGRDRGRVFEDLWRFDLATNRWALLRPQGASPDGRFGHTGTWVAGRGLVLWSGQSGNRFFNDLWLYRPGANRWARLPGAGAAPDARYGSCASLGPDGRLWISHGFTEDSGRFSDTRTYDFTAGRWSEQKVTASVPVIRCLHDCLWTPDGRLVLYGGQTSGVRAIGDIWSLSPGNAETVTWQEAEPPPLAPRNLYALGVVGTDAFVFGGTPREGAKLADTWKLDLATLSWSRLSSRGPSGRSGAAFVADTDRARLVLFGGQTDARAVADLWELRLPG
jgi:hypothetical protein